MSIKFSIEIEQRVLATLMNFGDHLHVKAQKAFLQLNTDSFYVQDNKIIFGMIRDCFNRRESFGCVDILVLIPRADNDIHESLSWIIANDGKFIGGETSFDRDIKRLLQLTRLRKQLALTEQLMKEVNNCTHPDESQQILNSKIEEITMLSYRESKDGILNTEFENDFLSGKTEKIKKIPTMCKQLNDKLDGGIMPKSLIIIAAGASVGKTGFSLYLMDCIARNQPNCHSLFFSIEMEAQQIWQRHVSICGGKVFDKMTESEIHTAMRSASEIEMRVYDTNICRETADIDFIESTSRLKSMEKPISVIVVDYLGLVKNKGNFDRNDLNQSDITYRLAQLAINLNCTVIALNQINRAAANRSADDRCPWPHDAADSSGGHRSSVLWFGVDRPALHTDDLASKNQFIVKCRKNKFGSIFDMNFDFNDGTFAESTRNYYPVTSLKPKSAEKAIFSTAYRSD